jgi:hypothetical protein
MFEAEPLAELAEGVFIATSPVRFLGLRLTVNMAVLRLADGGLLVYSPVEASPARRAAIDALGPVRHLVAPNLMHHLWLADWTAAYPAARVHAPAALGKKRRELRIDAPLDGAADFGEAIAAYPIEGFRLDETVLFHRPSRTLVVADLVHNIGRPDHAWTRLYAKVAGFHDRVALSRVIRWTAFSDRAAARRSLDRLIDLDPARLVVGHGAPVVADAPGALAAAYTWLPPAG